MSLESKANQLNLDETTKNLAQELLTNYLKKKALPQDEKLLVPCALYIACQSITMTNLSGEVMYGNGINLTQIIRWLDESIDMESFFKVLDDFLAIVKEDINFEIQAQMSEKIRQASMSFRIYKKFDQCIMDITKRRYSPTANPIIVLQNEPDDQMSSTPIFKDQENDDLPPPLINLQIPEDHELDQSSYLQNLKNLSWIIFLLLKQALPEYEKKSQEIGFGNAELKNTFLLIAHLTSVIISLPEGYTCPMLSENSLTPEDRYKELASVIKQVSQNVAPTYDGFYKQQFLDEIDEYMQICAHYIQELKNQIMKNKQIRSSFKLNSSTIYQAYNGLLEEGNTIANFYRKFHQYYETLIKSMQHNENKIHLDEECFLRQKVVYTPKKRSLPNQIENPQVKISQQHKLLNIDSSELLYEKNVSKRIKLNGWFQLIFKFQDYQPLEVQQSPINTQRGYFNKPNNEYPLFQQTPQRQNKFTQQLTPKPYAQNNEKLQPQVTPVSKIMQQFQWLKSLTQEINNENSLLDQFSYVVGKDYYNIMMNDVEKKITDYVKITQISQNIQPIVQVLMRFFIRVLEQMVQNENEKEPDQIPNLLKNPEFINALLAITIQTHQHINSKEVQMKNLLSTLIKLLCCIDCCGITTVELWRIISNFATFQKNIPDSITKYLFDLEKSILLQYIWEDQHTYLIDLLASKSKKYKFQLQQESQDMKRQRYFEIVLLRRLSHHIALRVLEIQQVLQIEEQYKEQAWTIITSILENPPKIEELWRQRHFDQIIICTYYMILKHAKQNPEFKKFRELYNQKFPSDSSIFTPIIKYYNSLYLPNFKQYLPFADSHDRTDQMFPQLMNAVPKQFILQSPLVQKVEMTPRTQNLISSGENMGSPRPGILQFHSQKLQPYKSLIAQRILDSNKKNEDPK